MSKTFIKDSGDRTQFESDAVSRRAAMEACGGYLVPASNIRELPAVQPVIVPCDYIKACKLATMNKLTSAVLYLEVLDDLKKHGYVLVEVRKEAE